MSKLIIILCFVGSSLVAGCGSETTTIPDPTSDAASPSGTSTSPPPTGVTAGIPNGTCSFTLVDGTTKTRWEGTARPRMNGTGNLLVNCLPKSGDDSRAELHFGNATFDGPRTYKGDELSSDGSFRYDNGTRNGDYDGNTKGASCTLVLAEAKLDPSKNEVPRGERIAGTFTCTAIVSSSDKATPKSYVVEDGKVAGLVEP